MRAVRSGSDAGDGVALEAVSGVVSGSESFVELAQGGVRGPSSSASAASLRIILVPPPSVFSPTYEVMTMEVGSMMPRSSTLPKSPRSVLKAPLNKLEPMAFPSTRPFSA